MSGRADPVTFLLVGCGRIGERHARVLSEGQVPGGSLVGVCDVATERRDAFAARFSVTSYANMLDAIEACNADAVLLCTPSGTHAELAIAAARLGTHVVTEKPMALRIADADAMIEACAEAQVKLFVVKQNRFNVPMVHARRALEEGRLGRLTLGTVRVRWCRDQAYYDQDAWRGTWEQDGGVLANQASHHIDALLWMMGPVAEVHAIATTDLVQIEVETTAVALLRFQSGALGCVEATTSARPRDLEASLSLLGERGTIEIAGLGLNAVRVWEFVDSEGVSPSDALAWSENPPDVYGFGHARFLEHVVDCITHNTRQLVDGFEGRRSLEVVNALYQSIESGRTVRLVRDRLPPHPSLSDSSTVGGSRLGWSQ